MKFRLKRRSVRFLLIAAAVFLIFQFTSGCFTFRISKKEAKEYFKGKAVQPEFLQYEASGRTINYITLGADSLPTVIFFHGSPGSWSDFIEVMKDDELMQVAQLVAIDRPGFGHSDFGNGVASLKEQVQLLKPLVEKYNNNQPVILVGHSLGGPLIARMAMDFPTLSSALIMVAPSIDPSLEPDEDWFRYPLLTPFLSWILPTSFKVSNEEIYPLKDELKEMLPLWQNITQPVTVIQGTDDMLVAPENADFAKEMLTNSQSVDIEMREDINHFIPWEAPGLIKSAILKYLDSPQLSGTKF